MAQRLSRLVSPAVCFGVILGLGMALMLEAVKMMAASWWIAVPALLGTFVLLSRRRFPVMLLLLAVGASIALLQQRAAMNGFDLSLLLDFVVLIGDRPVAVLCCEHCAEQKQWTQADSDYLQAMSSVLTFGLKQQERAAA